ncbi:NADPH-dependent FMN reductase [Sphingobacterium thalpophilum]|uniref:FMN-dependent NADPH-azoreductase n=1 Tax=Sphingobacterium thalpophilum TaxID=259 RepID=A0A4U9UUX4_9SPHI|nr:NAD(P)H-dependent oxidoreductase [Sphingobacterium thalpophilum]VTR37725.1 FMN-dependent NADPH-azoreductase [Sphingobacterium thalpophilum]
MILIISGTNRPNSKTFKIAKCYQQLLNRKSIENEILSLSDLPPNILETDLYGRRSTAFEPIQQKVSDAEMFIFIAPEYNGSIPGALKLFIDCCTFPISFYHKKVALVGLSSGRYGNIRGIDHLTGICHYLRMHVLPLKIFLPHVQNELDDKGELFKEDTLQFINEQIEEIARF